MAAMFIAPHLTPLNSEDAEEVPRLTLLFCLADVFV